MNDDKPKVMVAYIIEINSAGVAAEIGPFSKAEIARMPRVRRMPEVVFRREVMPYWWPDADGPVFKA